MNLILHDFYLVVDAKGFPFVPTNFQPFVELVTRLQAPGHDFLLFLDYYIKKPWKFFSFTDLLEYEAFILKLREEVYCVSDEIRELSKRKEPAEMKRKEERMVILLRGLRAVLEQSNFLDLKINYDFLLNPPSKCPDSSLISPLIFSDNPHLSFELLLTLTTLNTIGENLKALRPFDRMALSMLLTAFLNIIDLTTKSPIGSLIQGLRTEEDRDKMASFIDKNGLEIADFSDPEATCYWILSKKNGISENQYTLEQLMTLMRFRSMRYFANNNHRLFTALQLLMTAELILNGVKPLSSDLLETFSHAFKEDKRAVLSHPLSQMSRLYTYHDSLDWALEGADLSPFIFETLQISGFSYESLISEVRSTPSIPFSVENRGFLEGSLIRKWIETWGNQTPFFRNKTNVVGFLKLADKLRFSYENLEAQIKGIDSRGLLSFSENEKKSLDRCIEMVAMQVLQDGQHLKHIEFLVPIIIYFKTVYNQETTPLFVLLYEILRDLIRKSLQNSEEIKTIRLKHGWNLVEESILQLLQLFFVFEVRNEATETLNKQLLNDEFFELLEKSLETGENTSGSHFIFNQVLFHSLTNDNNIIRDFLIERLEKEEAFQRFLEIFRSFYKENKVVFLCNFNLLRKKVLRICEQAQNNIELLEKDPKNMILCRLYAQIFTSCFLLWADTSSLDNDFLEISCLRDLYQSSFLSLMRQIQSISLSDDQSLISLLQDPVISENKPFFLVFCDSLHRKYKLILENLLYFMRAVAVKLFENDISGTFFVEFLQTLAAISHPLVPNLSKDYHLSRFHSLFESNFTLDKERTQLFLICTECLLEIFKKGTFIPADLISITEPPSKLYDYLHLNGPKCWNGLKYAKKMENILILTIGILKKPLFMESMLNCNSIGPFFELVLKIADLYAELKPLFFEKLETLGAFESNEEGLEIDHLCSVHPQNDFSRKLVHRFGLFRQISKFLYGVLKLKTRGVFGTEVKKMQEMIAQTMVKSTIHEISLTSQSHPLSKTSLLRIIFVFDEMRRLSSLVHESKLPGSFLSEDLLRKVALLIEKMHEYNEINKIRHESVLPALDVISRASFYFFCRIELGFLCEFLIKTLLFNDFSFIFDSDYLSLLSVVFSRVLKALFGYWKGFYKSNEEIPLKLVKLIESLNSKSLMQKPKSRFRLLQLDTSMLQLFLESTYVLGLRIRSIYFYKLIHVICLVNDNKDFAFSSIKAPYLAFFIQLLQQHFHAVFPGWNIKNSATMWNILKTQRQVKPGFDPMPLIPAMGTIESACVQAMLTNLVARLLFSERQWDSDPSLQPGLKEMYWDWHASCDFARYVSLLLERLTKEQTVLTEEELDTLHNDTIGNLVEMLKDNLGEMVRTGRVKSSGMEEFFDVCFDFLEKYFNQQETQVQLSLCCPSSNVIRQEVLRDMIGIIGSGLLHVPGKGKIGEKIRKKAFESLFLGMQRLRMFKETGFHEKFSQELFRLVEIMIVDSREEIIKASIEFTIKSSFYDSRLLYFKPRLHYKDLLREPVERSFSSHGRSFVNCLYKLCLISNGPEPINTLSKEANSISKENFKQEDVYLTLRKGILPDQIQGVEDFSWRHKETQQFIELLLSNAAEIIFESIEKQDERPKILDLDLSVKILVLLLAKYPVLMPVCLEHQLKITKIKDQLTDIQKERAFFVSLALRTHEKGEETMNFIEFCYVFYDEKPHILRQFLLLYSSHDFGYCPSFENSFVSSSRIIKKLLIDLFSAEIGRFIAKMGQFSEKERVFDNSDSVLALRNLVNLYYKVLVCKGHQEESVGTLREKLLEFLEILLEILRKTKHPLDLIVLRDINYFGYLALVYKQIIKATFTLKTGLPYLKSSEYLKFYLNRHLRAFFTKTTPDPLLKPSKASQFRNIILLEDPSFQTSNPRGSVLPEFSQLLLQTKGVGKPKKSDFLMMKEREIYDYSRNVAIFNQNGSNYAKNVLESREDLRRLAPNHPDLNIYENMRSLIKAGVLKERKGTLNRENYDLNGLKYIVWPANQSNWVEKMQETQKRGGNNKRIFLTFEQMILELRSLTQEIRQALRAEALKYALEAAEAEENDPQVTDLQTQSCLTILGCEEAFMDKYYQNSNSEASIYLNEQRKYGSEQLLEGDLRWSVKEQNEGVEVGSAKGPLFEGIEGTSLYGEEKEERKEEEGERNRGSGDRENGILGYGEEDSRKDFRVAEGEKIKEEGCLIREEEDSSYGIKGRGGDIKERGCLIEEIEDHMISSEITEKEKDKGQEDIMLGLEDSGYLIREDIKYGMEDNSMDRKEEVKQEDIKPNNYKKKKDEDNLVEIEEQAIKATSNDIQRKSTEDEEEKKEKTLHLRRSAEEDRHFLLTQAKKRSSTQQIPQRREELSELSEFKLEEDQYMLELGYKGVEEGCFSSRNNEEEEEEEEEDDNSEVPSENEQERTRKSTEIADEEDDLDEEEKYCQELAATPTFLDRYGIDQAYFSLIPEEMREEVMEGARELYEERRIHVNLSSQDKTQSENIKKFRLFVMRERALVNRRLCFERNAGKETEDYEENIKEIEKVLEGMPYSAKKRIYLQADKGFLNCCSEKIRKEAEEVVKELKQTEVQSFDESNSSSKEEETMDYYDNECSEEEEEEKGAVFEPSFSNLNNPKPQNNECRSLKFIDDEHTQSQYSVHGARRVKNMSENEGEGAKKTGNMSEMEQEHQGVMSQQEADNGNVSNLAESSNGGESKMTEKGFLTDDLKRPQTSFLKKLGFDKEKLESDGTAGGKKSRNKTKRKPTPKRSGFHERFLFKNYKKIRELDENINKIDFFLEIPEIEEELMGKVLEMFQYSLVLSENASQLALKSVFKLFKYLLFNPHNAYKLIDGLISLLLHYLDLPNLDHSPIGYGLVDTYPLITKPEIIKGGVLNNLFSLANKLVENHYCLPLFLQSRIQRDKPLFFKETTKQRDYSLFSIRNLRKNEGDNGESMTFLNLLINYLTVYEGNGFLSYLNGDILLSLIKNILKLSVTNDDFLNHQIVRYPKYRIETPLCESHDINSLCQIFYQKRIRLKYFESNYYELFVEYAKSPVNFERFFLSLISNYTSRFVEALEIIRSKALEFIQKEMGKGTDNKLDDQRLKGFWENVLLVNSQTLAEDLHIFRHIVKDLVVLFDTPLRIVYQHTVFKEFHQKFGVSVKDFEKDRHNQEAYLKEWLLIQKLKKKEAFLSHLREKLLKEPSIVRFFERTVEVLKIMVETFGVEFGEIGSLENERLEDCYYFFIYPVKSLLILYGFLDFSQEDSFSHEFVGISGIKTREILKSEREFNEKEAFSEHYSQNNSGFLALSVRPAQSQGSDSYSIRTLALGNRLEKTFEMLLRPEFMKLITFFMQSKAEPDKLGNYLDYIRRAKKKCPLSLEIKLGYLRSFSKLKALSQSPHNSRFIDDPLTLYLSRSSLWTSTLETLLLVPSAELAIRPLKIVFEGEEGIDYGGITREWLSLLKKEVFDPGYGLFKLSANGASYQPNPLSWVVPDHLTHFRELGRLVGKVVLDNLNIEVNLVQSFLKHLLGQTLYIRDLSSIDPDLCKNLEWILENEVKDLDLTFVYDMDFFDLPVTVELVEDGSNLRVHEGNKKEYVKQMCYAKMAKEIREQTEAFLDGFLAMVPREALSLIDEKELGMKLCGTSEIDLEDMKKNTEFLSYSPESQVIIWMFEVLAGFDQETLAKFLFFVTGSFKVPYGGFKNFRIKIERLYDVNALPTAHTCFNQLDLPEYESKDKMREKMLVAILEGNKGFYIC